jgi:hypothetical protein
MDKRLKYTDKIPSDWRLRYSRARAQAKYRKEQWEFNIETWYGFWQSSNQSEKLGSKLDGVVMVRLDKNRAWSIDNCIIVSRRHQLWKLGRENFGKAEEDLDPYALYRGTDYEITQ